MKQTKEDRSIERIHLALAELMKKESFDSIHVSDIIKESHVSRSTFYSHYKSKDDVLDKLTEEIFLHVFSTGLKQEESHDFSSGSIFDYQMLLRHIFYHFREERNLIGAIFLSSASHRFILNLEKELSRLVSCMVQSGMLSSNGVPENISVSQYTSGLIELLKYYTVEERKESPEDMCSYFFSLYHKSGGKPS